jgi:hypothetical protein
VLHRERPLLDVFALPPALFYHDLRLSSLPILSVVCSQWFQASTLTSDRAASFLLPTAGAAYTVSITSTQRWARNFTAPLLIEGPLHCLCCIHTFISQ